MRGALARTEACGDAVLLVGDLSRDKVDALRRGAFARGPRVHSKASLLPRSDWRGAAFGYSEDLASMVDFHVAQGADFFVGSPFSSFSVLAALARPRGASAMADVDVADALAAIFRAQFPHADVVDDPCALLASSSAKMAKRLARPSCPVGAKAAPLPLGAVLDLRPSRRGAAARPRPPSPPASAISTIVASSISVTCVAFFCVCFRPRPRAPS